MFVTALCTACFSRAKFNKKNFGPTTLNGLAPELPQLPEVNGGSGAEPPTLRYLHSFP